jgi:hypothetical protein
MQRKYFSQHYIGGAHSRSDCDYNAVFDTPKQHPNSYSNPKCDGDAYRRSNVDGHSNFHRYSDSNRNSDTDRNPDSDRYPDSDGYPDSDRYPDSGSRGRFQRSRRQLLDPARLGSDEQHRRRRR